jgi:formylglycine-generating enzyme required for sulfatase activity
MAEPTYEELLALLAKERAEKEQLTRLLTEQTGPGGLAQGTGATAAGQGGIAAGRDIQNITIQSAVFNVPAPAGRILPKELLFTYLNQVVRDTARLDLTQLDRNTASDQEEARLELAAIYTTLDTVRAATSRTEELGSGLRLGVERETVASFVSENTYAALLGEPGSGKTTFANFLALSLAGHLLGHETINVASIGNDWKAGPLLPVRVILRNFAAQMATEAGHGDGNSLWRHIIRSLGESLSDFASLLKQHLVSEGGILILDGLDEVPEAHHRRKAVKQAVLEFRRQFPKVRILLTSRTYAYQRQQWRLPDFTEAVLAPFTDEQIVEFVDRWYGHMAMVRRNMTEENARGRAALLKQAIERNSYLGELARRPLLLTLMASIHAWRGGTLPEGREELYSESIDLLLDVWQRPKTVLDAQGNPILQTESAAEWFKAPREEIRAALQALAFDVHKSQPDRTGTADIKEADLVTALLKVAKKADPEMNSLRVIEYIRDRAGLFINRGEGIYSFPHRTFQEYLAARHLTGTDFPDLLVWLAHEDIERWREAVLLAGAKVARGTPFAAWALVNSLCPDHCEASDSSVVENTSWWLCLLAGQLLNDTGIARLDNVGKANANTVENVVSWLARLVSEGRLPPVDRAAAGIALGRLEDPRPGVLVKKSNDGVVPDVDWIEIEPGRFVMGGNSDFEGGRGFECTLIQKPYQISRYSITVAQYAVFAAAKGYEQEKYWTEAGWQWRRENDVSAPEDYDEVFQTPNHPRVGVSWYEAAAYCRWLSEALGLTIRLPSEAEWERAARHTDGRTYPWGEHNEAPQRCNMDETGIGRPSAVGMFPSGNAACGAADMSGNVWEWCGTKWLDDYMDYERKADDALEGDARRVLRGGAFGLSRGGVRCAYRYRLDPDDRHPDLGFRVVASPFSSRNAGASGL